MKQLNILGIPDMNKIPADTRRNNNAIITSKRTSQRRFDVIMTSLRRVSAGIRLNHVHNLWGKYIFHELALLAPDKWLHDFQWDVIAYGSMSCKLSLIVV